MTFNPRPPTPNPQPSTLNPRPSTLNPQPSTLNQYPCANNTLTVTFVANTFMKANSSKITLTGLGGAW